MCGLDYNTIMKDSTLRIGWLEYVMEKITKKVCENRKIPERTIEELREKLSNYPVEDGVSIAMMPIIPPDKEEIFVGDLYEEKMHVAFGKNKNAKSQNPYTIVITFEAKPLSEILYLDKEALEYFFKHRGIAFSQDTIDKLKGLIKFKLYENGRTFYSAVKNVDGEWLEQIPNEKGSFVPNRLIAKFANGTLHVHAPQKKCKAHQRTIEIE